MKVYNWKASGTFFSDENYSQHLIVWKGQSHMDAKNTGKTERNRRRNDSTRVFGLNKKSNFTEICIPISAAIFPTQFAAESTEKNVLHVSFWLKNKTTVWAESVESQIIFFLFSMF